MSDPNTIPIDLDREVMKTLLRKLQIGMLDRNGAQQLKQLLKKEIDAFSNRSENRDYIQEITELIKTLDLYISGKINLLSNIGNNSKISAN
jgi:hypothetical protein